MDRAIFYKILYHIFKFDAWHLTPADERPYAQCAIRKVNSILQKEDIKGEIIEIGCGLGDIIAGISYSKGTRTGYDVGKNVIRAAKFAHPAVNFKCGSFADINNKEIGIVIAVGFMHEIENKELCIMLDTFIANNDIDRIMVDTVPSPPYQYAHNYDEIMEHAGYYREWKSHSFAAGGGSRRYLLIYKNLKK